MFMAALADGRAVDYMSFLSRDIEHQDETTPFPTVVLSKAERPKGVRARRRIPGRVLCKAGSGSSHDASYFLLQSTVIAVVVLNRQIRSIDGQHRLAIRDPSDPYILTSTKLPVLLK